MQYRVCFTNPAMAVYSIHIVIEEKWRQYTPLHAFVGDSTRLCHRLESSNTTTLWLVAGGRQHRAPANLPRAFPEDLVVCLPKDHRKIADVFIILRRFHEIYVKLFQSFVNTHISSFQIIDKQQVPDSKTQTLAHCCSSLVGEKFEKWNGVNNCLW